MQPCESPRAHYITPYYPLTNVSIDKLTCIFYYASIMSGSQPTLILASTSPRRRDLITVFGLTFQFVSVDVDETARANEMPAELVRRLSRDKAAIGTCDVKVSDAIVVGADTIVSIDDTILGKPKDADDAVRMLKLLRNRAHVVYSGVTAMHGEKSITEIATTTVRMRNYPDAEIVKYVATGDPLDKAAAYAIQNGSFRPVEYIEGCFANVMGLPLCHLYRALKKFGVQVSAPDHACQEYLNIVCFAAEQILESVSSKQ